MNQPFINRTLRGTALASYKKTLQFDPEHEDIIIGTLLGDSTMGLRNQQPLYSLKFEQSTIHKPYIDHLFEKFAPFCGTAPVERFTHKAKGHKAIWFRTYRLNQLMYYWNLFYQITKDPTSQKKVSCKVVPKNIDQLLSPRALAYWFMDDGTGYQRNKQKPDKQYYFCTEGFTKTDCQRLRAALFTKHSLFTSLHKDRHQWRIYIRKCSHDDFRKIVTPYMLSCFLYKL
jgi:hypothetical protein